MVGFVIRDAIIGNELPKADAVNLVRQRFIAHTIHIKRGHSNAIG